MVLRQYHVVYLYSFCTPKNLKHTKTYENSETKKSPINVDIITFIGDFKII